MIATSDVKGIVGLLVLAAVFGAIGGLAAELLVTRRGQNGWLRRSKKEAGALYLGYWANIILGSVAALAALAALQTEVTTTNGTEQQYNVIKVISFALIVGSIASGALGALQEKLFGLAESRTC